MSVQQAGAPTHYPSQPVPSGDELLIAGRKHWFVALSALVLMFAWHFGFQYLLHEGTLTGSGIKIYQWGANISWLVGGHFIGAAITTVFVLRAIATSNVSFQHHPNLGSRARGFGIAAVALFIISYFFFYVWPFWMQDAINSGEYQQISHMISIFNRWVLTPLAFATVTGFLVYRALHTHTRPTPAP